MPIISIDTQDFMYSTTDQLQLAVVSSNMFGGIVVNAHNGQATSFSSSVGYLALTNIRFPGGQLSECGSIVNTEDGTEIGNISGADQAGWATGQISSSNYAYDLRYPDLINPALLAADTDIMSFSQAIALANANGCSIEMILPTVRYTDFQNSLTAPQEGALLDRSGADVTAFLQNLFVTQSYGTVPSEVILDIGNENLVWTTKFPGTLLDPGQFFDPSAVQWGIGLYFDVARQILEAAFDFRSLHLDANFKMAIQVPNMNDKEGIFDPVDAFLAELRAMPANELAQIDIIRFHPLDYSMQYAADIENWMSRNLLKYAFVINEARAEMGVAGVVEFSADAHSQTGKDDGGVGDGLPAQSLQAAAATVAAMSSLVEMGVDYASAWGIAINYREDVQASYYDPVTGATHYTPRGEVLRQMAETLPGMTLVNTNQFVDATRTGPVNLQAFGDGSTLVLFVSANDINDGDSGESVSGEDVTINLAGLAHPVTYAWIETITTADGNGGEAMVWNPLIDTSAHEKGEAWVTITGNSVTFHLSQDYEMIRLIVSTGPFGSGPQILMGDARRGLGIVDDLLATGAGADVVQGLTGSDTITGGAGDDRLYGDRADGAGLDGGDFIKGGAGNDAVFGGDGNDTLDGGDGADSIYGGNGNDVIYLDSAFDFVSGGDGFDTLILLKSASVSTARDLALRFDSGFYQDFERVIGSSSSDDISGDAEANNMEGGGGNDYLYGWAGNDVLFGGMGDDKIWGGDGNDLIAGNMGNDSLSGGLGNDTIEGNFEMNSLGGEKGNDTLEGGDGIDTASYNGATAAVKVSLALITAQNTVGAGTDTLRTIENLIGSAYNDVLTGDANGNSFNGGLGNDSLLGGAGNDTLNGGAGNDVLTGGVGTDTASYASATGAVMVNLSLTMAQITGGAGTDTLATIENLIGSSSNDFFTGTAAVNQLEGGVGADTLVGGAGADLLYGGDGDDLFVFALAADLDTGEIVNGGGGTDELRFTSTVASTLTLTSGVAVEKLVIGTGTAASANTSAVVALNVNASAAANGVAITGNAGANALTGSGFNDSINGGLGNDNLNGGNGSDTLYGGLGNDTLVGGAGADVFVFNTATNATSNRDVISDFDSVNDNIWLAKSAFAGLSSLPVGALGSDAFWNSATTHDATDRILYNQTTGALFYDADGTGATAAIQIAQLTAGANLTEADFFIM